MSTEAKPVVKSPIEQIEDMIHIGLSYATEKKWGVNSRFSAGIIFEKTAIARLSSIFGMIIGLKWAGKKEFAESLAFDLFRHLDYLADYGGAIDPNSDDLKRIGRFKVVLYDDGSLNGFGVVWHSAVNWHDFRKSNNWFGEGVDQRTVANTNNILLEDDARTVKPVLSPSWTTYDKPQFAYKRWMNGGLIYSGPGIDEPIPETFKDNGNWWGLHT